MVILAACVYDIVVKQKQSGSSMVAVVAMLLHSMFVRHTRDYNAVPVHQPADILGSACQILDTLRMCVLFLPVLCHIALLVSPKGAKIS